MDRSSRKYKGFGLVAALALLGQISGCRSDESNSGAGLPTSQLRSLRVPQQRVKEPLGPEDAADSRNGERLLHPLGADAGVQLVEPLRGQVPLEPDNIGTRESTGVVLEVEWKPGEWPAPSGVAETSTEGLEEARSKTRPRMRVTVAQLGRITVTFLGQGFPWPEGTELRARADRYGQILVWPDKKTYRVVAPGALRAMFADRRLDLGPLFVPKLSILPPSQWLGQTTARSLLTTPVAEIELDQATIAGAGLGAELLCRLLVELAGVEPDTRTCHGELLPLRAQITNAPGGKLGFAVTAIGKKQELDPTVIQVPPEMALLGVSGMPKSEGGSLERGLIAGLRHRAVTPSPSTSTLASNIPTKGLVAKNGTLGMRALIVDGTVVAWLDAGQEVTLTEFLAGTYSVAWRDFFGTFIEPVRNVTLPARLSIGGAQDSPN